MFYLKAAAFSKYNLLFYKNRFKTVTEATFLGYSADDCANACSKESTFQCESFSYCWLNGECRLARKVPASNDEVELSESCDIYERKKSLLKM